MPDQLFLSCVSDFFCRFFIILSMAKDVNNFYLCKKEHFMKRFFIFWKKITWIYVRFVQKILITIFLTTTYLMIFPFMWFFHILFSKKKLITSFKIFNSYWETCGRLEPDPEQFQNQS